MELETILQTLTLEEKAALLQGWTTWTSREVKRLGIPSIFLSDGPHGLRKQEGAGDHLGLNASVPATCFPTAATMANSWDPALGEELGRALGEEAAAHGVHVVLGPGMNIKRSPLCGRSFEYFSEDPYLSGKMAAAYVRGIQSAGPSACPKHFAVNSQELRRMCVDSVVDERTLRELYLTGFEIAVKEGHPKAIMSAYNKVNGSYANENRHLLQEILRQDWGFDGFVVTDWGGDNLHAEGVKNGSALVMPAPGPDCAVQLVKAVREGRLEESALDDRLREFLPVVFALNEAVDAAPKTFDAEAHHAVARRCAEGSLVLLENDGILPLDAAKKTAVIGDFAKTPRYQGAGSSMVNPTRLDSLLDALTNAGLNITGFESGFSRTEPAPDAAKIQQAVELARASEVVLLCVGLDEIAESEGMDRNKLELSPGQQALIEAVCAANENVVLVLSGGAPFVLPAACKARAVLHGYLGGQAGAGAMADALLGKLNPNGKLNESWPLSLLDVPSSPYFPGQARTAEYREGLYVGYRYYDTAGVPVRWAFGHGLSYTTFAYSDLQADATAVTFTVTNTGSRDGAEVAQVYVSCPEGRVFRPAKELKGFVKVFLKAGESRTVTVPLDDKAFRYWNVKTNQWQVEGGSYTISVGAASDDIRLQATVQLAGDNAPLPYDTLPSYETGRIKEVSNVEFAALLGRPIPDGRLPALLDLNDAIGQMDHAKNPLARLVCKVLLSLRDKAERSGKPDLNILFITNMPFRALAKMTLGGVSEAMAEDILLMVNGHFFKGAGRLIRDHFRHQKDDKAFVQTLEVP